MLNIREKLDTWLLKRQIRNISRKWYKIYKTNIWQMPTRQSTQTTALTDNTRYSTEDKLWGQRKNPSIRR